VAGRHFTAEVLREAVAATRQHPDLDLLAEGSDNFGTYHLVYRGGARDPALERLPGRPDLLEAIWRPRAGQP
jgi:hypothetical protein